MCSRDGGTAAVLGRDDLDRLLDAIRRRGFRLVGPVVEGPAEAGKGAICYGDISSAAFLITADHGLNAKTRCWDLAKACKKRGLEVRFALSAERDRYVKHHRNTGGTAWVYVGR